MTTSEGLISGGVRSTEGSRISHRVITSGHRGLQIPARQLTAFITQIERLQLRIYDSTSKDQRGKYNKQICYQHLLWAVVGKPEKANFM